MKEIVVRKVLLSVAFWLVVITAGVGISWTWNLGVLEKHALSLANERGRYTFKIIESTRLWVAQHGVAYVLKSESTPSNPYLHIPEKDIVTPSGKELTAVNPAYMTRQLAAILKANYGLLVHLTSLKPLNPNNTPDPWEAGALGRFESGDGEVVELQGVGSRTLVRYMAPLFVKPACMSCHEQQGYEVGDVRGGISVSFPFEPFLAAISGQQRLIHLAHLGAWLVLSLFAYITVTLLRRYDIVLERSRDEAERLVEQRTHELRQEVQIRRSTETQLQLLLNSTEEGIFGVDSRGGISFMNPAGLNILGYHSNTDVVGHELDEVFRRIHSDDSPVLPEECQIREAWQRGVSGHSEDEQYCHPGGKCIALEYHVHPIFSDEKVVGAVVNFSDISIRKALQDSMWRQANFDSLTGIPNRALLFDRLRKALEQARRSDYCVALLYIDLNAFKPINDRYGHEAGDEVLRNIAQRLAGQIRESDTVARIGGDEFVVVLSQASDRASAESVAGKLSDQLEMPIGLGDVEVSVGVSIGVSLFPLEADNMDSLLAKADQAMYQKKSQKR